jgi:type IV pilus assembly protein PilW
MIPRRSNCGGSYQTGLTLIELMIALTLGMLVVSAVVAAFVNSSRTRDEVERTNQQIENGRYAMQVLGDDLRLAGYLAEFNIAQAGLPAPAAKPDPCAFDLATLTASLPLHIQGYDNGAALTCLSDVRPNTDILVVRRASTCVSGAANCATVAGAPYFQASLCNSATELGSANVNDQYRLDTNTASLDRHRKDCTTLAATRQYVTRIYFVANNDATGDGIPTLKRAELGAGGFSIVPIAEGIENLQLEHGIDTDNDGTPNAVTADPDTFNACAGIACVTNWLNVVSVRVNVLARTTSQSSGTDSKTYTLGLQANGTANTVGPFNDRYKRHVFQTEVRLNNPAGRRE